MTDEELKIFNYIVDEEDKYLEHVRKHINKIVCDKYGEIGKKVCEEYYDRIDGVIDDIPIEDSDCQECEQKRKDVSDNLKLIDLITKVTQSYSYNFVKKTITENDLLNIDNVLNDLISKLNNTTLYKYNRNDLVVSILIQFLKKKGN
jgi:predicted Ser/Thr protein kinase